MMQIAEPADSFAEDEEVTRAGAMRAAQAASLVGEPDEARVGASLHERLLLGALLLVATAWLAAIAWIALGDPSAPALTPTVFAKGISYASGPLVLIGVALLLLLRMSRREQARFAGLAAVVRAESIGLNTALSLISRRLEQDRAAIAETSDKLMTLADETSRRLSEANAALAREAAAMAEQAKALDDAAAAARLDIGVLLTDLPDAESKARALAETLRQAGSAAQDQVAALEARLAALGTRARECGEATGGAADRLVAGLADIDRAGNVSVSRIIDAAGRLAAVEAVLERAAGSIERTRDSFEARRSAIAAVAERASVALAPLHAEAAALAATIREDEQAPKEETESGPALISEPPADAAEPEPALYLDEAEPATDPEPAADDTPLPDAAADEAPGVAADAPADPLETEPSETDPIEANEPEADRAAPARPMAHMVDSLNVAAIEIGKTLAADVADPAWQAYLKGDASAFTRRAIRLLEAGDTREIMQRYDEDPGFRGQVRCFLEDFEAMLHPVLATQDGARLGVALLSSESGKLYAALSATMERQQG